MDLHRHRRRERSEYPCDPRLTILIDTPDHTADVRDLHAVALPRNRPDDISIRHEIVDISLVHERMTKRDDLFAIHCRHRACRTDAEIPVDECHTDGLTARERRIIACVQLGTCAKTAERQEGGSIHWKVVLQIAQPRSVKALRKEICLLLRRISRLGFRILGGAVRMCGSRRRLRCRRRVGVRRSILRLLPLQHRDHIAPLCFALGARHLREFLLTLAQTAFLLRLLALLKLLYNIDRINIRLILRVRHRPDWRHVLDRRDEERIGAEILQTCSKRTNKTTIHIDRAAAHPLKHTADLFDEIAARPCHDHAL